MNRRSYMRIGWKQPVFLLLLLGILVLPVQSSTEAAKQTMQQTTATSLNAIIYIPTTSLQPLFQERINQQIPTTFSDAISQIVNKLPAINKGWAQQMAKSLIHPTATISKLTPQKDGIATSLSLSLYPGDPKPTDINMLIKFSVLNASTIQVSAQPLAGSPTLVNGPLTTIQMPLGQLDSINASVNCGDAALMIGAKFPIVIQQGEAAPFKSNQTTLAYTNMTDLLDIQRQDQAFNTTSTAYVEVPASALASLGSGIGSLAIGNGLTAQNLQIGVKDNNLVVTSDVMLSGTSIKLATATTYIQPGIASGNLIMHVIKTTLAVLVFTFPNDSYNKQIEKLLNEKLGNLFSGQFNATNVSIGSNSHIPCAANDSLILTGTTSLG